MAIASKTAPPLEAGSAVGGKYLLVERIGDGGMGSVWRAFHQGLAREVAVKFVNLDGAHAEERVERFLREAKMCAAIRHRCVVDIFDVDTTPQGQPYMVMELLRGQTLAERTARPPSMPVDDLVRILAQCLSGLGAVHRAGVVHRDLKPENIFLAEYDEGIVPKIVDFGISREQWKLSATGSRRLTRQGTVLGTPWYMAPEQARASEVGPQADVYAIGVIAYEALAGHLPFDSESLTDLLLKITTSDAPPIASIRPDLPVALSDVVAKAMARDLERRFKTALEMRAALLRAIDGMDFAYAAVVPSDATIVLPRDIDASGRPSGVPTVIEEPGDVVPRRATSGSYRRAAALETVDAVPRAEAEAALAPSRSPARRGLVAAVSLVAVAAALVAAFLLGRSAQPVAAEPSGPPADATPAVVAAREEPPPPGEAGPAPDGADEASAAITDDRPRPRAKRRRPPAAFRNLDF